MKYGLHLAMLVVLLLFAACTALPPVLATRTPSTPAPAAPPALPALQATGPGGQVAATGETAASSTPAARLALPVAPGGPTAAVPSAAQAATPAPTAVEVAAPSPTSQPTTQPAAAQAATPAPTAVEVAAASPTSQPTQAAGQSTPQAAARAASATPPVRLLFPFVSVGKAAATQPTAQPGDTTGVRPPTDPARPNARWTVKEQKKVGAYTLTLWHDATSDMEWGDIGTVSAPGQPAIQVADASAINEFTGKDLTGDGTPDAIIETFTGGAHCCFGVVVYELGKHPAKILDKAANNCGGQFQDVNHDGRYEFLTCDDAFAYTYCPYATSPKVQVVYEYKASAGYRLASPRFAGLYSADIQRDTVQASTGKPGDLAEWDDTNKCSVLPLVLDYLYSGQTNRAWQALDQHYLGTDKAQFRQEVNATVTGSAFYVAP